jgi:hypothetical protein
VIAAERVITASPEDVFSFLRDLENHWQLADRFVEVVGLDRASPNGAVDGGQVRIRGPIGLSRTATTRVLSSETGRAIRGSAELGDGTRARIEWRLVPDGGETRVVLGATVERASALDRLFLLAGGSIWLRRRFAKILEALSSRFSG